MVRPRHHTCSAVVHWGFKPVNTQGAKVSPIVLIHSYEKITVVMYIYHISVTMLLFDYYCCIDIASDIDDVMICNLLVMHYCVMYYDVIISLPCCAKR